MNYVDQLTKPAVVNTVLMLWCSTWCIFSALHMLSLD